MFASVLINNYNYGKYLKTCIESVLQQSYSKFEVIVYDDGSTDDSLNTLNQYKDRIAIISRPNYGKTSNINQMNAVYQAFLESRGDVIFLLDSDDYFHHEKIEKVIGFFKNNPDTNIVQHPMYEVDGNGHVKDRIRPVLKKVEDYKGYIYSTQNLFHLFVPTSGLAFKREFLKEVLPLEEDELSTVCVDTRLMLSASLKENIKTIEEPLSYYRIHGANNFSKIGNLNVHKQYTEEVYGYFNSLSLRVSNTSIFFDKNSFFENTFFYPLIDLNKIKSFIEDPKKEYVYWLWGAGEAGQTILYALREGKHIIKGFIDTDRQKQGAVVMGKRVHHFDEIDFSENIRIILSPYHAYQEITKYLNSVELIEEVNFIFPYRC